VPVGSVSGDVDVVVPVNDVVEPLAPDGLTAAGPLVIPPGVPRLFVDTPDPAKPGTGAVMLVETGEFIIEELPDNGAGVPLLGVNVLEFIGDETDDVGVGVCVNSIEIPLLPSTDPV